MKPVSSDLLPSLLAPDTTRIKAAEADVSLAKIDFDRIESLRRQNAVSQSEYDTASNRMASQQARLANLKSSLKQAEAECFRHDAVEDGKRHEDGRGPEQGEHAVAVLLAVVAALAAVLMMVVQVSRGPVPEEQMRAVPVHGAEEVH